MNHFMLHDAAKMGKKNGKRITCCQAVFTVTLINSKCLQCFDAVGWAAGRASGL